MFTSEQLDALQAAAEAATPGKWFWTEGLEKGEASLDVAGSDQFVLSAHGMHAEGFLSVDEADAEFIAAANPAVVLELVAAHRAALARIARIEALHQRIGASWPHNGGVYVCQADGGIWPCPTVRALTEGEPDAGVLHN